VIFRLLRSAEKVEGGGGAEGAAERGVLDLAFFEGAIVTASRVPDTAVGDLGDHCTVSSDR
jgi:hypothetical protein